MIIKDEDYSWCVYIHISPSNKYYVGITGQKPERRWRNGDGYKYNKHFTNAIKKYGWDNFEHEIIASNLTEEEAKNFEKILISKLQSNKSKYGYNRSSGGESAHHCEETKQLLREIKGTPVCQFDLDMNLLKEYPSINFAAETTGIWESMILGCCHNKIGYKTAGGYVWILKSDLKDINFDEYKKYIKHEKLPKPVCQFSLNMEFIKEYESIGQAGRVTGIPYANISMAASGKYNQACGYIWIFKEDLENISFEELKTLKEYKKPCCKSVYKFSLDMTLIEEFDSRVEAGKSIGVTPQAIGYACNSKTHKSHNYIWWFKEDYERMLLNESHREFK